MANKKSRIKFNFENMEYAMNEKKIKPTMICKETDNSYSNYKSWKKEGRIAEHDLEKIARFLNVDFEWLRSNRLYPKNKIAPKDRDYIRDKDGFIIPPFNGKEIYDLVTKNAERLDLFLEWIHSEPLFDFVNKYLTDNGEKPIQKKAFNEYMKIVEVVIDGEVFEALIKIIADDITFRRKRIKNFDDYLKNK